VFAIATLRVTGYQLAFFLLHGLAVLATARRRPTGWAAPIGVVATQSFLIATLALFAASVDDLLRGVVTIYPRGGLLP
jgi:hypothetical protein